MLVSKHILTAINLAKNKQLNASDTLLQEAELLLKSSQTPDEKQLRSIQQIREIYKISTTKFEKTEKDKTTSHKTPAVNEWDYLKHGIDYPSENVMPGVSLVTCCMNRSENLINALKTWLEVNEINEVIIVDWSSTTPVKQSLDEAGIKDNRILVVRIEDQPRWILSYAFNIGFRASRFEKILKTDADIIIKQDFFTKNTLSQNDFIAGNWRKAPKGQEHVNGFFYIHRSNLMKIKGFNEHITTYGWDDDDIYSRMHSSGLKRVDVDLSSIYHIPHDDSLRLQKNTTLKHHLSELHNTPKFKIRYNRFIANSMPDWNFGRVYIPITILESEKGYIKAKQSDNSIHLVPQHVIDDAEYYAEAELTSWKAGIRSFELPRDQLRNLLKTKSIDNITQLDLEVAIHNKSSQFKLSQCYLVLKISPTIAKKYKTEIIEIIEHLYNLNEEGTTGIIIASDSRVAIADLISRPQIGFVPIWRNLGSINKIEPNQIHTKNINHNTIIDINNETTKEIHRSIKIASPIVQTKRKKFYVDAQHGLGNRLRAIGSAAAIAKATNRELIIIWEPDHHCECEFHDLFNYEGAVINKSFIKDIKPTACDIYNYMEIEDGAQKDKEIKDNPNIDIYGRAAYIFRHPASHWEEECQHIRALKASDQLNNLLAPFTDTDKRIGAHIRMEAGKGLDNNTYDSIENWTKEGHDQLHYWRDKSHFSVFLKKIDALLKENKNEKIFLAADLKETYEIFDKYYGDKITYLKREKYDRSKEQILYAMADAILLSRCHTLLGSTWSSFTELAIRLAKNKQTILMSGTDF